MEVGLEVIFAAYIYPILKIVITIIFTIALGYLARKFRLEGLIGKENHFAKLVLDRVFHFEELDKKMFKSSNQKLGGEYKFNKVLEWVRKKKPRISEEEAREIVQNVTAACPDIGAFSGGFIGELENFPVGVEGVP